MTMSNMRHVISGLAALVLLFGGVEQSRAGTLALEFTSSGPGTTVGNNFSIGWSFTTTTAISITALDAWNVAAAGSPVRLYNSGWTTLASATVLNTDPIVGAPTSFFSHAISPVPLAAGTYYIAEDIVAQTPTQWSVSGLTTAPAITFAALRPWALGRIRRRTFLIKTRGTSARTSTSPPPPNRARSS